MVKQNSSSKPSAPRPNNGPSQNSGKPSGKGRGNNPPKPSSK